jgi:hypothetical protein
MSDMSHHAPTNMWFAELRVRLTTARFRSHGKFAPGTRLKINRLELLSLCMRFAAIHAHKIFTSGLSKRFFSQKLWDDRIPLPANVRVILLCINVLHESLRAKCTFAIIAESRFSNHRWRAAAEQDQKWVCSFVFSWVFCSGLNQTRSRHSSVFNPI